MLDLFLGVSIRLSVVPFGIRDGDSSASMSS